MHFFGGGGGGGGVLCEDKINGHRNGALVYYIHDIVYDIEYLPLAFYLTYKLSTIFFAYFAHQAMYKGMENRSIPRGWILVKSKSSS